MYVNTHHMSVYERCHQEVAGQEGSPLRVSQPPFINNHVTPFYRMFTSIYSLLIEKGICDCQNISSFRVFMCFQPDISSLFWCVFPFFLFIELSIFWYFPLFHTINYRLILLEVIEWIFTEGIRISRRNESRINPSAMTWVQHTDSWHFVCLYITCFPRL